MTFEEFLEAVQAAIAEIGSRFTQPDEDWAPMIFTLGPDGFGYGPIAPSFLSLLSAKRQEAATILPAMVAQTGAYMVATLIGGVQSGTRQEVLLLMVGAPERLELWSAPLQRAPGGPPRLGPWQQAERPEGPFLDGFRRAWTTNP